MFGAAAIRNCILLPFNCKVETWVIISLKGRLKKSHVYDETIQLLRKYLLSGRLLYRYYETVV